MRLIDADKLMEDIIKICKCQPYLEGMQSEIVYIQDVVDEQPTAFNVDKVISNIWDRSELIHIKHNCYDEVEDYIRVTDVSEIVKAGGIDEHDRERCKERN